MTGPVGWKAHFIDRTQLQNAQQMRIWIRKFLNTVRNFILHYIDKIDIDIDIRIHIHIEYYLSYISMGKVF